MPFVAKFLKKAQSSISLLFIYAFLLHGIIYFFFPQDIQNPESPLKWIKYIIVLLLIAINFNKISIQRVFLITLIGFFLFFLLLISNYYVQTNPAQLLGKFIPYFFPATILLLDRVIDIVNWRKVAIFTLLFTSVVGYVEFYVLKGIFEAFYLVAGGDSFRISSVFINPNNAGLLIALLNYYIIENTKHRTFISYCLSGIIFLNSSYLVYLTGSKTGFVVLAMYLLYVVFKSTIRILNTYSIKRNTLKFLSILCLLAVAAFYVQLSRKTSDGGGREVSLETGEIRAQQMVDFVDDVKKNFLFPFYDKEGFTVDNAYIQLWGDTSIIGMIIFCGVLLFSVYKMYYLQPALIFPYMTLLLCGFSLNIFYIWPTAYVFWVILIKSVNLRSSKS